MDDIIINREQEYKLQVLERGGYVEGFVFEYLNRYNQQFIEYMSVKDKERNIDVGRIYSVN